MIQRFLIIGYAINKLLEMVINEEVENDKNKLLEMIEIL